MIKKFLHWLLGPSYQSELEGFISSKQPQSTAEVEWLTLEYQRRSGSWL